MGMSTEYPDLKWVTPNSWRNANRSSVQLIVIHTTEGSAHEMSAEDGASYDSRRTDGTSTHYFHDNTSTVQCVRTEDVAYAARTQGNLRGIQHELCGRAGWSASTWTNTYGTAMLKRAAKQAARDSKKWNIPVRHLTVQQVRDGYKGFCGHWDVTRAFPEDNGTHTDPGPNFPWTMFLDMVRAELAPAPVIAPPPPPPPVVIPEDMENNHMVILQHPNGSWFHLTSKGLVWISGALRDGIVGPFTLVTCDQPTWDAYRAVFDNLSD
jgi:hypothetical protein